MAHYLLNQAGTQHSTAQLRLSLGLSAFTYNKQVQFISLGSIRLGQPLSVSSHQLAVSRFQ